MEGFGPGPLDASDEDNGGDEGTNEPTEGDGEGGEDGGEDDDDDEEGKCNPNFTDKVICQSGKAGKSWSICKNLLERKFCPRGHALCGNGRCYKQGRLCGSSGVKIPLRPCDPDEDSSDENGENGETYEPSSEPTGDEDERQTSEPTGEEEDIYSSGEYEDAEYEIDVCSEIECDNDSALCLRRQCQDIKRCALKRNDDALLECVARSDVTRKELCRALNRRKNKWTKGWCSTEPACTVKRRGRKLFCVSR